MQVQFRLWGCRMKRPNVSTKNSTLMWVSTCLFPTPLYFSMHLRNFPKFKNDLHEKTKLSLLKIKESHVELSKWWLKRLTVKLVYCDEEAK